MAEREKGIVPGSQNRRSLETDFVPLGGSHSEVFEEHRDYSSLQTMTEMESKKFGKVHKYSRFGVLVVGKTGTGKSCLINNIFAEEVAKEGHSLKSETKRIKKYRGEVRGSEIFVYDTPGLEDTEKDDDREYLKGIKQLIALSRIDLTVCCVSMKATRFDRSLTRTFKEFSKIGLKWENTIFALTFADEFHLPPKLKVRREEYFREKVEEWRNEIQDHLKKDVGLPPDVADRVAVYPATHGYDERLPSKEDWFSPLWLAVLKVLPNNGVIPFLRMHQESFAKEHLIHQFLESVQELEEEVHEPQTDQPQDQQPQDQQEAGNQPHQRPNIDVDDPTLLKRLQDWWSPKWEEIKLGAKAAKNWVIIKINRILRRDIEEAGTDEEEKLLRQ